MNKHLAKVSAKLIFWIPGLRSIRLPRLCHWGSWTVQGRGGRRWARWNHTRQRHRFCCILWNVMYLQYKCWFFNILFSSKLILIFKAETPADLDAISKWLDIAGNKLDYRRYGEVLISDSLSFSIRTLLQALLEILIAGGLLAPGGSIQQDGDKGPVSTSACIFQVWITICPILLLVCTLKMQDANDLARIKQWDNVIIKLMRRYKYLEKMLSEEMKKILVYLRGFTEQHRTRLAQITAIWCCSG